MCLLVWERMPPTHTGTHTRAHAHTNTHARRHARTKAFTQARTHIHAQFYQIAILIICFSKRVFSFLSRNRSIFPFHESISLNSKFVQSLFSLLNLLCGHHAHRALVDRLAFLEICLCCRRCICPNRFS